MDESTLAAFVIPPMGVGEVVDVGLKLARQNYRRLAQTIAYAVVPAFVLGVILELLLGVRQISSVVLAFGQLLASFAVTIAGAGLVAPASHAATFDPRFLYRRAAARLWRFLVFALVSGLLAIPLLIVSPLGIFCAVRWSVSLYSLIIEGDGPIRCLRRSWFLTKGAWWHTFGVFFLYGVVITLISLLIAGVFAGIGSAAAVVGSATLASFFIALGSAISAIFVAPFATLIGVVLYYELRARREGFDLESRALQQWHVP